MFAGKTVFFFVLVIAVAVTGFCPHAIGDIVESTPLIDGYGRDHLPNDGIFDDAFTNGNNRQAGIFHNTQTVDSVRRPAFEFLLPVIGGGDSVESVVLQIEGFNGPEGANEVELHGYQGDGAISTSDFEVSNLLETRTVSGIEFVASFDVTNYVSGLYGSGQSIAGFQFRLSDESFPTTRGVDFIGTQWPGGGDPPDETRFPRLFTTISTVPEPSGIVMMGFVGLLFAVRRRSPEYS